MTTNASIPLCVDLDGTLLASDSLVESFCQLLKQSPGTVLLAPFWLMRGKANLKDQIARRLRLNVQAWPLNHDVLHFVQAARQEGRTAVLATAADRRIAEAIQARLNLFDEVFSSDGNTNLSGQAKADLLVRRFGAKQFDYIGNSRTDLPVWRASRSALVAGNRKDLVNCAESAAPVSHVFARPQAGFKDLARALRIHQWSKNLLLLIPLLGAHQVNDPLKLAAVLLGMVAFSLCASSVYLLNDLMDLDADRHHHSKQHRPFASGKLPLVFGLMVFPMLLALSAGLACCLGRNFAAVFGIYYLLTLLYSLRLKEVELLDVLVLAGLYGIRILGGGAVAGVVVSDWLLMFSLFAFLSLAFVKRFTELRAVRHMPGTKLKGRAYVSEDKELVSSMGVGSGYLSVLVLAMYVSHPSVTVLYHRPEALWFACPVLFYWISRVWLLAHRGNMHDDPILFALRDRQSWLVALLLAIIGYAAGPK